MAGIVIGGSTASSRVAMLAVALAVAACAGDPTGDEISRRHPLDVERHPVRLTVMAVPTARRIGARMAAALDEFFAGYVADGGGQMRITTPPGAASGRRSAMAGAIRDRAVRRGVNGSAIVLVPAKPGPGTARTYRLHYSRHAVRTPRCGDWSTSHHFNVRNRVHPNYGCASQSYLGAMAAQPLDLVTARRTGPRDTTRSNAVIGNYRKGEPTAVKPNPNEGTIRTLTTRSSR